VTRHHPQEVADRERLGKDVRGVRRAGVVARVLGCGHDDDRHLAYLARTPGEAARAADVDRAT
jgi:hypothetical protein